MSTTQEQHTTSNYELDILREYACLGQLNILTFRRIFLLLTRVFFSDSSNFNVSIQQDWIRNLLHYTYSDPILDPDKKVMDTLDIRLSHQYADNISKMEYIKEGQKPLIIINVGDFVYQDTNIIDLNSTILKDGSGSIQSYNTQCTITFHAYARTYDDSALLAQLLASHFSALRPYMIRKLNLKEYKAQRLTAPVCINADEANKTFQSSFILDLAFENNYLTKLTGLRVKTTSINVNGIDALN